MEVYTGFITEVFPGKKQLSLLIRQHRFPTGFIPGFRQLFAVTFAEETTAVRTGTGVQRVKLYIVGHYTINPLTVDILQIIEVAFTVIRIVGTHSPRMIEIHPQRLPS